MRYFFDVREDGDVLRDEEGLELPDLAAAIAEATRSAASICAEDPPSANARRIHVSVRGEDGQALADAVVSLEITRH